MLPDYDLDIMRRGLVFKMIDGVNRSCRFVDFISHHQRPCSSDPCDFEGKGLKVYGSLHTGEIGTCTFCALHVNLDVCGDSGSVWIFGSPLFFRICLERLWSNRLLFYDLHLLFVQWRSAVITTAAQGESFSFMSYGNGLAISDRRSGLTASTGNNPIPSGVFSH